MLSQRQFHVHAVVCVVGEDEAVVGEVDVVGLAIVLEQLLSLLVATGWYSRDSWVAIDVDNDDV